jgi:thiol-disulfide isomerase/thioredoxin
MVLETLTERDFQGRRLNRPGPVVTLFAARWCPYCRAFRPRFETSGPPAGVKLAEVVMEDYDDPLPSAFGIEVIPTVIAFQEGDVAWRDDGIAGQGLGEPTLRKIRQWTGSSP